MDENNLALNEATEATTESPQVETEAQEKKEVDEVSPETTKPESIESDSEEGPREGESKKDHNTRIRELNAEKKAAQEEARSLAQRVAELTAQARGNFGQPIPQQEATNGELTLEQLDQRYAAMARLENERSRMLERVDRESQEAIKDYKQLDPGTTDNPNPDFDPELSEGITEATLAYIRINPNASVKEYVGKLMKPYIKSVNREAIKESEAIVKQQSQSALRPTSVKLEKPATEKTIAELEKELGIVQP